MKRIVVFASLLFLLSGCTTSTSPDNLEQYVCTEEQLKIVAIEYEICASSSYFSSYCFEQAKKAYCDYVGPGHEDH